MIEAARICNHTFLPHLIDADSVVVDIGVDKGEFSAAILERFGCRVIAAEPVKTLFERIPPHPRLNLTNVALGGTNEWTTINVFPKRSATLIDIVDDVVAQPVEQVTLTEFRRRAGAAHIDLLKMDIEGAEIALFNSTPDAELQNITQITIEFHDFIFPDQKEPVRQIRQRLRDLGFWDLPFSIRSTDVLFLNKKVNLSAAELLYLRTAVRLGRGIPRKIKRGIAKSRKAIRARLSA